MGASPPSATVRISEGRPPFKTEKKTLYTTFIKKKKSQTEGKDMTLPSVDESLPGHAGESLLSMH